MTLLINKNLGPFPLLRYVGTPPLDKVAIPMQWAPIGLNARARAQTRPVLALPTVGQVLEVIPSKAPPLLDILMATFSVLNA